MKTNQRHKAAEQPAPAPRTRRYMKPEAVDRLRAILARPFIEHTSLSSDTIYNCVDEGLELAGVTEPEP